MLLLGRLTLLHHGRGKGSITLVKQLRDFKATRRTNDAGNMASVSKVLTDQDIEDFGHYHTSLR